MSELKPELEEMLELIWMLTIEKNKNSTNFEKLYEAIHNEKEFSGELTKSLLEELISLKFIEIKDNNEIYLIQKGYDRAREIIRCHRLYERLFTDVLRMDDDIKIEKGACVLEHVIAEDIEEKICTLLGHPKTCPHGKSIPLGPCCKRKDSIISSILTPVTDLEVGETGVIAYLSSNTNREMDKLLAFGILPGNSIKLHQKMSHNGPVVIQIDQTQVALERSIADQICVRRKRKT